MADGFEIKFNTPFDKAREAAQRRGVVLPSVYYGKLPKQMRSLANTISYIQSVEQIQTILDDLTVAIDSGNSFEKWRKDFNPERFGITKAHAETVYRNALQTQYSVGRWEQAQMAKKTHPYLRYVTINDSRTSQCCRALSGIIRPIDSPFWATHTPPNHHRCRSILVSLTAKEAQKRSPAMVGLNQPKSPDMQPQKGWDYNPALSHQKQMTDLAKAKIEKLPVGTLQNKAVSELAKIEQVVESTAIETVSKTMTLDDIYKIAEKEKPAFDSKIQQIANFLQGEAILPPLKSIERAQEKIDHVFNGKAEKIADVLRASIIFEATEQVNVAFEAVKKDFAIDDLTSYNGYARPTNSVDGYYDAKVILFIGEIKAELQLHTKAMMQAKEKAHELYRKRQAIERTISEDARPTKEQQQRIDELNAAMAAIFLEAKNE